jgi:uncharacterized protein (TIGR02757 family)
VAFPHRYTDRDDQEIAAIFASVLAFGRVSLFRPVLAALLDDLDRLGGPAAALHPGVELPNWRPLYYRWTRGDDLVLLAGAVARLREDGIEAAFYGAGARGAIEAGIDRLRAAAVEDARARGFRADTFEDLPRGLRVLLPSPRDGSACKRWNMLLRWLVRPKDGIDLGLWTKLRPADLVIPLDVHVGRISRFVGLTTRTDASWRTAEEVTAGLRLLDPADPVRFDFALAHLGISGRCVGRFDAEICPTCPLSTVCIVGSAGSSVASSAPVAR